MIVIMKLDGAFIKEYRPGFLKAYTVLFYIRVGLSRIPFKPESFRMYSVHTDNF